MTLNLHMSDKIRNIDNFKKGKSLYESTFLKLLGKITQCHKLLMSDNEEIENHENILRNCLLKDYLNNNQVRKGLGIKIFHFEAESAFIDSNYRESGYFDIKVTLHRTFDDSDVFFIFECKRLDGYATLNRKYIEEGMMRFVTNKYRPSYSLHNTLKYFCNIKPPLLGLVKLIFWFNNKTKFVKVGKQPPLT